MKIGYAFSTTIQPARVDHGSREREPDLKLRRSTVDLEHLKKSTRGNARDEIAFRAHDGALYVLDGVELDRMTPLRDVQIGARIRVGAIEGEVVHVDMESSQRGLPVLLGTALASGWLLTMWPPAAVGVFLAGIAGSVYQRRKKPDDSALSQSAVTLAESRSGNPAELEAMLVGRTPA